MPGGSPVPENTVAAFAAVRHPDTIETRVPYRVEIRQLSGPDAVGGYAEYTVWSADGKKNGSGKVRLTASDSTSKLWTATLPPQPIDSVIKYHYVLFTAAKRKFRHPSDPSTNYRFQVIPFHLSSLRFQKAELEAGNEAEIALSLDTRDTVTGDLVLRVLPQATREAQDVHIRLQTETDPGATNASREILHAKLPALVAGQAADFYFQLRNSNGDLETLPSGAPAQVFSVKRSFSEVRCIPVKERFVLDVASAGEQSWVALKGGGTWAVDAQATPKHWGTCEGNLSNVSRFTASDGQSTFSYIGSDHGVIGINENSDVPIIVLRPEPSAWGHSHLLFKALGKSLRAGPGAMSPLDGTVLFQYEQERALEERYPQAAFLQIDSGRLIEDSFRTSNGSKLIGISSASFDGVAGCWLLGAFVTDNEGEIAPAVVRRCGESELLIRLRTFEEAHISATPQRIISVAPDPETGSPVVAVEFQTSTGRKPAYGVFRVHQGSGQLVAIASAMKQFDTEIACVTTDWNRDRILVGTFGDGAWEVKNGTARKLDLPHDIPTQITRISVNDFTGRGIIGTSDGAYELAAQGQISSILPRATDSLPADSMPMDAGHAQEVLFSSYSYGLKIARSGLPNDWHVGESWLDRINLLEGHVGDAQLTKNGGIAAVLYGRGLLLADNTGSRVLGKGDSLYGTNPFRVLALPSGDIWLAYEPFPFGPRSTGAIQVLKGDEITGTFEMPDRGTATISRWIQVSERKSIFAATRSGVIEIQNNGSLSTISPNAAASIARSPDGVIGAVGTTVERWDGQKFVPVFYQVKHPRWARETYSPGSPIDIAIDSNNFWYVLYGRGVLAILDSKLRFRDVLDNEDGIPQTSQRLLAIAGTGQVFVGSTTEGVVSVRSPK